MDTETKSADLKLPRNGFYVQGVVIANSARSFRRKDGFGIGVRVVTELALQPGIVTLERYFDPAKDTEVKVQGEQVVSFPKMADFTCVTLRVEKYRIYDEKLIITAAEKVG